MKNADSQHKNKKKVLTWIRILSLEITQKGSSRNQQEYVKYVIKNQDSSSLTILSKSLCFEKSCFVEAISRFIVQVELTNTTKSRRQLTNQETLVLPPSQRVGLL